MCSSATGSFLPNQRNDILMPSRSVQCRVRVCGHALHIASYLHRSSLDGPMRSAAHVLLISLLFGPACATSKSSTKAATDHNVITQEQMREHNFTNAYDAVAALHANWLQKRGTDSFLAPGEILVYLDETKLGGIETLR